MAGGDAIVSNCFVSHLIRPRESLSGRRSRLVREVVSGPLEMCLVSACTLRRQLNLSTVAVTFHYFLEDTLPEDLVAPFRAVADSVELLPPFQWPGRPLASTQRDRLYSFNKLRVWTLTQFHRVLYFDPDVFWSGHPGRYLSRFGHAPHLAAAEYHGSSVPRWWAQQRLRYINSGIMVLRPNITEYHGLMRRVSRFDFATETGSQGARHGTRSGLLAGRSKLSDQDVIRAHFEGRWTPMPECENFRGYIRPPADGQAGCDPSDIVAWHGSRLRGMAPRSCHGPRHPPPLPRSFRAWLGSKQRGPGAMIQTPSL